MIEIAVFCEGGLANIPGSTSSIDEVEVKGCHRHQKFSKKIRGHAKDVLSFAWL
ncbi:hypothetical protein [Pedobacter endophyticus]|uniref:Uncharacterized protein n=1 Tax=Pedobacter endophyticus TaxID=2789740 RepID=A0A7U3Q5C2_9SPHI|nr:hypothetical protein [Pedobacter endophyticus]QPH38594.1 hypothetical protein IZT61_16115 [Pedobacter endophyticus]